MKIIIEGLAINTYYVAQLFRLLENQLLYGESQFATDLKRALAYN